MLNVYEFNKINKLEANLILLEADLDFYKKWMPQVYRGRLKNILSTKNLIAYYQGFKSWNYTN